MQRLLLALACVFVIRVHAQETHFIPVPKALNIYDLPFDEKNQTKITLKTTEPLIIPGATTEAFLPTIGNENFSAVCKLTFKSEYYERSIPAGETYYLKEAPEKIKEPVPSFNTQKVKYKLQGPTDSEVPLESMICYGSGKGTFQFRVEGFLNFNELSCLLDVTIKAPLNRKNPPVECRFKVK